MGEYLDIYCERSAPGLWNEPLNALSNAGFLFAAALLLRRYLAIYRGHLLRGWDRLLLIALLAAIGLGSGLWHLYAERWAMLADVLPILLFISVFLLVFLTRVAGLGILPTLALFLLYHAINLGVQAALPADFLNGSVFYLPTWAAVALMALWLVVRGHAQRKTYLWAAGLFLISLAFRTADMALCPAWPAGTHFLWHLLNAVLLYVLVWAVLQSPALPAARGASEETLATRRDSILS